MAPFILRNATAAALLTVVGLWIFTPLAMAKNSEAEKITLPAAFHKGLVFVKVAINKAPAVWMDLDTGTSPSIVDSEYARSAKLRLTKTEGAEGFGTEKITTLKTSTAQLHVGKQTPYVVKFESIELNGMKGPDSQPLAGLLGYSFLAGKILVIDYKMEELYFLNKQEKSALDIPMKLVGGLPLVRIEIGGQPVDALIDTGGTYGLLITPDTVKKGDLQHYQDEATPVNTQGHGGEHLAKVGKAPGVTLGGLVVTDVNAVYTSFGTASASIPAGASLGKDFLKAYKLTLNYVTGTARFEPAALGQ